MSIVEEAVGVPRSFCPIVQSFTLFLETESPLGILGMPVVVSGSKATLRYAKDAWTNWAGRWAKILEPLQLLFFGRLALSAICLLIEGNSKNLSLFVSWKGSIWGKILLPVIVHLLESFRMSLAGESVSNYSWLDRMMYATAALITSVTSRSCRFSKLLCRKCQSEKREGLLFI